MLRIVVRPHVRDGLIVIGLSLVLGPTTPNTAEAREPLWRADIMAETVALPLAGSAPASLEWLWTRVRDWLEEANREYQERIANPLRKPPRGAPPAAGEPTAPPSPAEPLTIAASPDQKDATIGVTAAPPPSAAGSPSPVTIEAAKPEAETEITTAPRMEEKRAAEAADTAASEARALAEEEGRATEALDSEASEAVARAEEEAERRMIAEAEQSAAEALDAANARLAEERRIEEERARERSERDARDLARATDETLAEGKKPRRSAARSDETKKRSGKTSAKPSKTRVAALTTGAVPAEAARRKRAAGKAPDGGGKAAASRAGKKAVAVKTPGRVVRGIRARAKVRLVQGGPKAKRHAKRPVMRVHIVRTGETLSRIAWMHYRSARRYVELQRANRSKIKDPDLIYPGQRLTVPVSSAKG